jgi:hypothetical protein
MNTLKWKDLSEINIPENLWYWYTKTVNEVKNYSTKNVLKHLSTVRNMCKLILNKGNFSNDWILNVAEFERNKVIILNSVIELLEREEDWNIIA